MNATYELILGEIKVIFKSNNDLKEATEIRNGSKEGADFYINLEASGIKYTTDWA